MTPAESSQVAILLPEDANDYYYSACMSVVDGLRAIDVGFFTWSTVKLYYSVFYAVRALLAIDKVAVFWPDRAPFRVHASPGSLPTFVSGEGTHTQVLNAFRGAKPTHAVLSQDIDLMDPLDWMVEQRNRANYFDSRFCEPQLPAHFEQVDRFGVRQAVAAYLGPNSAVLAFDKDHAIVAFPLLVLQSIGNAIKAAGGAVLDDGELGFLVTKCQERKAALAPLMTFIKGTLK